MSNKLAGLMIDYNNYYNIKTKYAVHTQQSASSLRDHIMF